MSKVLDKSSQKRNATKLQMHDELQEEKKEVDKIVEEVYKVSDFDITKKELPKLIERKKKELVETIVAYAEENNIKVVPYSKVYQLMSSGNLLNKTKYSSEELAIAFEVYKELVGVLATKNNRHSPSKQNFCSFIGISTATFNNYKESDDPSIVEIAQRIDDYLTDVQLQMAQAGILNAGTTIFRMKAEHGYVEPKEIVHVREERTIDSDDIRSRIKAINEAIEVEVQEKKTK